MVESGLPAVTPFTFRAVEYCGLEARSPTITAYLLLRPRSRPSGRRWGLVTYMAAGPCSGWGMLYSAFAATSAVEDEPRGRVAHLGRFPLPCVMPVYHAVLSPYGPAR